MLPNMLKSGLLLALFTALGTGLLLWIDDATRDRIQENERLLMLTRLHEIIPDDQFDNDPVSDTITINATEALGSQELLPVYRARMDGNPVAAILTTVAPDGYNGAIRLLVGVYMNGEIAGVRAIQHKETPGLGDKIETSRSDWILGFKGKHLQNPPSRGWAVKPDGGEFDAFTGATITPRAVVKAVNKALGYFAENRDMLLAEAIELDHNKAGQ